MNNKYAVTVCAAALMIFGPATIAQAQESAQAMESQMKAAQPQVQTRQISPAANINTPTPPASDLPVPTGATTDANAVDLSAMSGGTSSATPVATSAPATKLAPEPTPVLTPTNPQTIAANTRIPANASTTDRITNIRDAVAVGVMTNPQTETVENNRRATDEELRQAKALWMPSIDARVDGGYQYTSRKIDGISGRNSDNGTTAEAGVTLTQLLFDGFNTKYENERQEWRVRSASHRVRETAEFLGLDIIEAYIDVLRQRELLAIAVENTRQHSEILGQIQDATNAGRSTQADVEQTNARMAAAKASEANQRQALRDAETTYRRRVGDVPQPDLVRPAPPRELLESNVEDEVKQALTHSPTLDVYEADVNVAAKEAKQTVSTMYPQVDLQLNANAGKDTDITVPGDTRGASALVIANWNLYRGGGDVARQREFIYRHAQSKSARNDAARTVELDVRQTWASMVAAAERADQFGKQADANGLVVQAYKDQFNLDRRTLLDVLDSQNEWFVSRNNAINNQYLEMFAVYRLLAVKGELLSDLQVAYPKEANPADTSTGKKKS